MPEDNLAQFKQILSKLPDEKRKRLYDRLHAMPASQREAFIADFTRKYKSGQRKHPSSKNASQTRGQVPAKKAVPANEHGQKAKVDPNKQAANKTEAKKVAPAKADPKKSATAKTDPSKHAPSQAASKKHSPSQQDPHKKNAHAQSESKKHVQSQSEHNKPASAKADHQKKQTAPSGKNPQKDSPAKKPGALVALGRNAAIAQKKKHELEKKPKELDIEAIEEEIANLEPIEEEVKEPPRSKEASIQSVAIGLLIALVIVGLGYIVYLFNKASIDKKFNQMFGMPDETITTTPSNLGIEGPEPSRQFPTDTPTPIPPTPTPKPVTLKEDHPDLKGKVIVIDPGHQAVANTEMETVIKGTSAEKDKATTGAVGVNSGAKEYEVTLTYAEVLKQYLEGCGAKVILTRDSNDADISNIERAKVATDINCDMFIRLHADSAPDSEISGVKVYVPSTGKYAKSAVKEGNKLAELVAKEIGSTSLGTVQSNMYTGLNYADSVKSYQLVIGYLSNSNDDAIITDSETPYKVAVAVSEFLR